MNSNLSNFNKFKVIILAGGYGTRLKSTLGETPKVLAPINKKAFIDWLIIWINSWEICTNKNIILSTCIGHEKIQKYCLEKNYQVSCIREEVPLGTFGAIANVATKSFADDYLIINGDTIFKADLKDIAKKYKSDKSKKPLILLKKNKIKNRGGYFKNENNWIYSDNLAEYISLGTFFISYESLKSRWIKATNKKFENKIINQDNSNKYMIDRDCFGIKPIKAVTFNSDIPFIDIGSPDAYEISQTFIPRIIEEF